MLPNVGRTPSSTFPVQRLRRARLDKSSLLFIKQLIFLCAGRMLIYSSTPLNGALLMRL